MSGNVDNLAYVVDNSDPKVIWKKCIAIIKENVNPQSFQTWFLPIVPVALKGKELTIKVPSQFFYDWLEEHYPHIIRNAITQIIGEGSAPVYTIAQNEANKSSTKRKHRYSYYRMH